MKLRSKPAKVISIVTLNMCLLSTATTGMANSRKVSIIPIYQGGDNAINIKHEIKTKNNNTVISIREQSEYNKNQIKSITLPNSKVIKSDQASFSVKKSGTYVFKVTLVDDNTILYPVDINVDNKKTYNKIIKNNVDSQMCTKTTYIVKQGDTLNIEYLLEEGVTPMIVNLNLDGIVAAPYFYNTTEAAFDSNYITPGEYKTRLVMVDLNGKQHVSNELNIVIKDSNSSITTPGDESTTDNNKPSNPNEDTNTNTDNNKLQINKNVFSVGKGEDLNVGYTLPEGEQVKNISLEYGDKTISPTMYDSYEAYFNEQYLNQGTYTAKLKITTLNGVKLESDIFKLIIGNNSSNDNDIDDNKDEIETPSITIKTSSIAVSEGDNINVDFNSTIENGISYITLETDSFNTTAMHLSNNNATFSSHGIKEGRHEAILRAYSYTGQEVISNKFNILVNKNVDNSGTNNDSDNNQIEKNIRLESSSFNVNIGDSLQIRYNSNTTLNINSVELELSKNATDGTKHVSSIYSYYANGESALFNTNGLTPGNYSIKLKIHENDGSIITSKIASLTAESREVEKPSESKVYTPKDSMTAVKHEGIPNGAPVDWKYRPRIENLSRPSGWNALGQWGQVYLEEGQTYAKNTGVELSNFKMYGYSEQNKEWKLLNHSIPGDAFYREDFAGDANMRNHEKIKCNYDSKTLVVKLDEDTKGYALHPFSKQIDSKKAGLPDVKYVVSQMDVKLVKWDEKGIDDRDSARYVANIGGDWWRNVGDTWQPDWSTNKGIAQGQFRTVTKEKKTCYMTNIPMDIYDQFISSTIK